MAKRYLPYSTQSINNADIQAVTRALRSPYLTQGPAVTRFEAAMCKKTGARFAVAFSNGTATLHAAYAVAGIGRGDEVLVPALTFAATANAALYLGAKPVFVDIDLSTGNISVEDAAKKITKRTKAIVSVDYSGRPADISALQSLTKKHKLIFIEDSAQALGASYKKKPIGTQAAMSSFSLHPVKSITTGEGGIVTTDDETYARKLKLFRHHGISKDRATFERTQYGDWYQEMQILGYNYRLSDIHAALGESQLKRLDRFIAARRTAANRYPKILANVPHLILPPADTVDVRSAWHLYPVRLAPAVAKKRDAIFKVLHQNGIGVQVHYLPVYLHRYYEELGYKRGLCPNAEEYAASMMSIPLFPSITEKEQRFVAATLKRAIEST